jgi:hypothetical protein
MRIPLCLIFLSYLFIFGCATHSYIAPTDTDKPCEKNFRTEGTFVSGRTFMTEAPIASKSLSKVMDQLIGSMPKLEFKIDKVDKKSGEIEALHLKTLEHGKDRAAHLFIKVKVSGPNPSISLRFVINPGQVSFEGDVQHDFCEIISATEIATVDY